MNLWGLIRKLLVFAVFLFVSFIAIWQVFRVDDRIKNVILKEVRPFVGDSLFIEDIGLRPNALIVRNIKYIPVYDIDIKVKEIRIGFSIVDLITAPKDYKNSITHIAIHQPVVTLLKPDQSMLPPEKEKSFTYSPFVVRKLSQLQFIPYLDLFDASVASDFSGTEILSDLNGRLLFDERDIRLNVRGNIPFIPGGRLKINGSADASEGTFIVEIIGEAALVAGGNTEKSDNPVDFISGRIQSTVEIIGEENLDFIGSLKVNDVALNVGKNIQISGFNLQGNLFGTELTASGALNCNGIDIPISAEIVGFLAPEWHVEFSNPAIDLSRVRVGGISLPEFKGIVNLNASMGNEFARWRYSRVHSDAWMGDFSLISESIALKGEEADSASPFQSLEGIFVQGGFDSQNIYLDTAHVSLLSGDLYGQGSLSLSGLSQNASPGLSWEYSRRFSEDDLGDWIICQEPTLNISGKSDIYQQQGFVLNGEGSLRDELGAKMLGLNFSYSKFIAGLIVSADDEKAQAELRYNFGSGVKDKIEVQGVDLAGVCRPVLSPTVFPQELHQFKIDADFHGDFSKLRGNLDWYGLNDTRSGSFAGDFIHSGQKQITLDGGFNLRQNKADILEGKMKLSYEPGKFNVSRIEFLSDDKKTIGSIAGKLNYNGKEKYHDVVFGLLGVGRIYTPDSLNVTLDNFPVFDLLHYIRPEIAAQTIGNANMQLVARCDSLQFVADLELLNPHFDAYSFVLNGGLSHGQLTLDSCAINQFNQDEPDAPMSILQVKGGYNIPAQDFDSIEVSIDGLSIEHVQYSLNSALISEQWLPSYGGKIYFSGKVNGSALNPAISFDAHLTSGMIHSESGYWANLQISSADSAYTLERFDLGKDIRGLIAAGGKMRRVDRDFELNLHGDGVEVGELIRLAGVQGKPLAGTGRFNFFVLRQNGRHSVHGAVNIKPGMITALSFDELTAAINVSGLDEGLPVVELDTVRIDWGDSQGLVWGKIPLTAQDDIQVGGQIKGRLLSWLTRLEASLRDAEGIGEIEFTLGGTIAKPRLLEAGLQLTNGGFQLPEVVSEIRRLNADIRVDSTGQVVIHKLTGKVEGNSFAFSNRFEAESGEHTLKIGDFDLGIFQFKTQEEGIWLVIPSLMKRQWGGFFRFSGKGEQGFFEVKGPAESPRAVGTVTARNATFTYPFLTGNGKPPTPFVKGVLHVLENMNWDAVLIPERGCRYVNEISGFGDIPFLQGVQESISSPLFDLDLKISLDLVIDEQWDGVHFTGAIVDSFGIDGEVTSSRGRIDYLDLSFTPQDLRLVFNPAELSPMMYGSASTTVIDSSGIPTQIRLILRRDVKEIGLNKNNEAEAGNWEELSLAFEDDQGHSQEQILAMMGYAPNQMVDKISGLGSVIVSGAVPIREWTRSLERSLQRWFGVDRFEIEPRVTRNLIDMQLYPSADSTFVSGEYAAYLMALDQSRLTVGKYIARDLYVSYTGLLQRGADTYNETRLGMVHSWAVVVWMPQIAPRFNLNYSYTYDSLLELGNHSVRVSYRFFLDKK